MNDLRHADLAWLALVLGLLLAAYWNTALSMAEIWSRSQTFAHGFLVFPVSLWMVWRQRAALAALPRAPSLLGLCALAAGGAVWLVAAVANVQFVQQYCLIMMIVGSVAAMLGWGLTRNIAFPLTYLLLAVPCGEILIPPLMDYTASFVTAALRIAGIPVFRDSNNFSLPSGNWSVVEACSGLRYLIASLALGLLFAYLNYRQWRRRTAFVVLAALLPIAANGVRAFLIVLLGHFSEMRFATGIDHLLYGWIFFGLVMLLLFWFGRRWREAEQMPPPPTMHHASSQRTSHGRLTIFGLGSLGLLLTFPMAAAQLDQPLAASACSTQAVGSSALGADEWRPLHKGCYIYTEQLITLDMHPVAVYLTRYRHQGKDADLLTSVTRERAFGKPLWRELPATTRKVSAGARSLTVQEFQLTSEAGKRMVWRWYRQSGIDTSSPILAKLLLARSKLTGADDAGAEYALATPYDENDRQASETLQAALTHVVAHVLPTTDQELSDAAH